MAQKEAIAIVLDTGPAMNQAPPGSQTPLESAIEAISMILQRKIFSESKDEVCLILCGTRDTENELSDGGTYANITLARRLGTADWDLMQAVLDTVAATDTSADFLDAIVVAVDHLVSATEGKKGFASKRVILFSDLSSPFGDDGLADIIASLKHTKTELNVIGPDLPDDEDDEEGGGAGGGGYGGKPKTPQQRAGEALVKHMLQEVEGACYSFEEALPALSYFQTRNVKQVAWKVKLEIGDSLQIPLCGYTKVKEAKKPTFKKVYAKDPDADMQRLTTFHLNDEDATEIEKSDCVKGYRYGNTLVPFGEEDEANMKYQTEKGLTVLGFTTSDNIKRHYYLGDGVVVFVAEKGDESAAVALSALISALYETNHVIIARRVYMKNSAPKMGFLSPHIKAGYECLVWNELPYIEDLRQFTFGSLPVSDDAAINTKFKPSEEQLNAVDNLIDNMDLTKAVEEDEDEFSEALKPKLTFNPYLQRLFQCVQHRVLSPDEELPELSPLVAEYMKPPSRLETRSAPALDQVRGLFKLVPVKKEKKDQTAGNVFKDDAEAGPSKKARVDGDLDGGMEDITRTVVNKVGTANPVDDFVAMLGRKDADMFATASEQLQRRIEKLVTDSFGDQLYPKALECLAALREACVKNGEPGVFNAFIQKLKEQVQQKDSGREDFWQRIVAQRITVIIKTECGESDLLPNAADNFLAAAEVKDEPEAPQATEDADDLLDML